jgi:hypothetical protein
VEQGSLEHFFRETTSTTDADSGAWLSGLRANGRFVEDIWGG